MTAPAIRRDKLTSVRRHNIAPRPESTGDGQVSHHSCHVYRGERDLIQVVAPFLIAGLQGGEQCWYVSRGNEVRGLRAALAERGVPAATVERQGRLQFFPPTDVYATGQFSPERLMHVFSDAISKALADGFAGFRAAGEMSWADGPALRQPLLEYEHLITTLLRNSHAYGLCLYDVASHDLHDVVAVHPCLVDMQGASVPNPHYRPGHQSREKR